MKLSEEDLRKEFISIFQINKPEQECLN